MNIEQTKENKIEHSLDKENIIQLDLKEAEESFCYDELIDTMVLECTRLSDGVRYKDESYNDIPRNSRETNYYTPKSTIYLPIFVLDYNGFNQIFTSGWFGTKKDANDEIKELKDKNKFKFKIESEDEIIHSRTNKKYMEKIQLSNIVKKYIHIDDFDLTFVPILISFGIFVLSLPMLSSPTMELTFLFVLMLFSTIFILIKYILKNALKSNFKTYEFINIPYKNIKNNNLKTEDKIITTDITVTDDGLRIYSEELDCKWFYERKKNKLLPKEGQEIIEKLPAENNECIIRVKNSGNDDSPWKSSCGNWWIDTKTSF